MFGMGMAAVPLVVVMAAVTPDGDADGASLAPDAAAADGTTPAPAASPASGEARAPEAPANGPDLDNLEDSAEINVGAPDSFDSLSLEDILNMRVVTATGEEEDRALAPANVLV